MALPPAQARRAGRQDPCRPRRQLRMRSPRGMGRSIRGRHAHPALAAKIKVERFWAAARSPSSASDDQRPRTGSRGDAGPRVWRGGWLLVDGSPRSPTRSRSTTETPRAPSAGSSAPSKDRQPDSGCIAMLLAVLAYAHGVTGVSRGKAERTPARASAHGRTVFAPAWLSDRLGGSAAGDLLIGHRPTVSAPSLAVPPILVRSGENAR